MIITSIVPAHETPSGNDDPPIQVHKQYMLLATEEELDKIRGISGNEHISGRYKVKHEVHPAAVFDKVDLFAKHAKDLKKIPALLRDMADNMENLIPGD